MVTYTNSDGGLRFYLNGTMTLATPFGLQLTAYISPSCSSSIGYSENRYSGSGDLRFAGSLRDYRVYKTPLRCARSTMADMQFGKVTLAPSTLQLLTFFAPFPAWFVVAPLR